MFEGLQAKLSQTLREAAFIDALDLPPTFGVRTDFISGAYWFYCKCRRGYTSEPDQRSLMIKAAVAWEHYHIEHEPEICIGEYAQC